MKKRVTLLISCFILILGIVYFSHEADAGSNILNLTTQSKSIAGGKSITLKVNGIKSRKIKWKSSKPSVATVSKAGVVTGIKKGKTTITGKYKGIKFTVKITVTSDAASKSDTPKIDKSGLYLGSCQNIDFYYMKKTKKSIYIKVINKNNKNLKIKFDYVNIDSETFSEFGGSEIVAANDFRTIELYAGSVIPEPQKRITAYVQIWTENYDDYGKGKLSATIE